MNELAFNWHSMKRNSMDRAYNFQKNILIKSILSKRCFHKMALNNIIDTKPTFIRKQKQ